MEEVYRSINMEAVSQLDLVTSSSETTILANQATNIPLDNYSIVTSGSNQEESISQTAVPTNPVEVSIIDVVVNTFHISKELDKIEGKLVVGSETYKLLISKLFDIYTYYVIVGEPSLRGTRYIAEAPVVDGEYYIVTFNVQNPIQIKIVMKVHKTNAYDNPTTLTASTIVPISGNQPNNVTMSNGGGLSALSLCSSKSRVRVNIDLQFTIMGTDIGDTMCVVRGTKQYFPRFQFPRELIGVTQGVLTEYDPAVSNFSFQPDYVSVMKGCGCTAWQCAKSARECDPKGYNVAAQTDVEFYRNVCTFMVFRYYLAGLSSGKFNVRWLLRENTDEFYEKLLNSDFKAFIDVFSTYGFGKYERYMKRELC